MADPTKKDTYQQPTLIEFGELSEMTHGSGSFTADMGGGYQTLPG